MSFWRLEGCGRSVGGDFVRDWLRFGARKLRRKRVLVEWHQFWCHRNVSSPKPYIFGFPVIYHLRGPLHLENWISLIWEKPAPRAVDVGAPRPSERKRAIKLRHRKPDSNRWRQWQMRGNNDTSVIRAMAAGGVPGGGENPMLSDRNRPPYESQICGAWKDK